MNLNARQIIAIVIAILSVFSGSTAQLTDLFGSGVAKIMISFSSLATTTLSSVLAVISSQGSTIKEVAQMPGVEKVSVNAQANPTLAALAVDPNQAKIAATAKDLQAVAETAAATGA